MNDGSHYEGDWFNDEATGDGKYYYANGNIYKGQS